jgi:Mesyanzhinovviridae DNA primase
MSATGVTGPGRTEGNDVAAITAKTRDRLPTQTELENEAGRKAVEHHTAQRSVPVASNKANGAAHVSPGAFSFSALPDTGIIEAVAPCAKQHSKKQVGPDSDHGTESDTSLSLDFLDDFFGSDKRHLVAIKKPRTKGESPIIKAHHFDAADRDGQQKFIGECSAAGFDLYFSPNPVKGTLHKKATKSDVVEARHLWIDLDPRSGESPEAERNAMLAQLTTKLPQGIPRPNRVIDSGRGYWGYWKLATPQPVDGRQNNVNGPLTEAVECYGRGIEQAFGNRFADGCRNIDRVARLPGTINRKTGKLARVLHEFSHDEPHPIENFPPSANKPKDQEASGETFTPSEDYEPVTRDAPELAEFDAMWARRIFEGDVDGKYKNDRSRLAFAAACELVRAGLGDEFIARALMTTQCGVHVQESPARRLPRTIRRAHEFAVDPDLEAMNSQHAVLPIGDKTRVVTWGDDHDFPGRKTIVRAQTFPDFKNLHSNKRKLVETGRIGDNGKPITKRIPRGEWWLRQQRRRQYDGGQRFMPQHEAEVVGNVLNMYQGFPIQPRKPEGRSAASGCQLFLDHGRNIICSGSEEHWDYLLKREAWIAQNRRRSEIAAAYRTEAEGSGKGFWCNHLGKLYGPHYMQVSNPAHVIGKHNPHLETLLKLCADEALFVHDPRHRNALFSLITEPRVTIEPKYINAYSARNYLNIDINTNAKHFVPASRTARRFFIPTVSENRVGDHEYFKKIEEQLADGGYEALLYHLLHEVDLCDFEVRRVPKTAGLAEQVEYSRKGLDGLVEQICSEGRVPCAHPHWPGFSVSNGHEEKRGFDYFIDIHPDRELRGLGALKVKRQLRRDWACMSGDDAKRRDGNDMIYGVKWPSLKELRELFEECHGPQDWLHPEVLEWPVSSPTLYDEWGPLNDNKALADEVRRERRDLDLTINRRLKGNQANEEEINAGKQ